MSREHERARRASLLRWCVCGGRLALDGTRLRCERTCAEAPVELGPFAPYVALVMGRAP